MTEQRRLAAILVADVVGYSKLIGSDEAGTLAQLQALRNEVIEPQIAKHAGRLFKSVGDGFLIEFASAVQAVSCAKAIQEANDLGRLPLRIGIHVGDVVVQGDDLMGDGVNVAARVEGISEPGGIAITRAVHEQVRDKLDLGFKDKGEIELKNILRPVQVFVIGGAKVEGERIALSLSDKPSIAVLPFANMSDDPQQDYFVDGLVEDVTAALSRTTWLRVIARNAAFSYKRGARDLKSISEELAARYLVEGSVRMRGQDMRVSAQLIDAASGSQLWAGRYDRQLGDVFAVQDEITWSIVSALHPELTKAEMLRSLRKPPQDPTAWDLLLRARAELHKLTKPSIDQAKALLSKAVSSEPDYAEPHVWLSVCFLYEAFFGWSAQPRKSYEQAAFYAATAARLDPQDAGPLHAMSSVLATTSQAKAAVAVARRAIDLDPNSAAGYRALGAALSFTGDFEEAIDASQRSLQASARDLFRFLDFISISNAHFCAGRSEEAYEWARKCTELMPNWLGGHLNEAATAAEFGDQGKASAAAQRLLALVPGFRIAWVRKNPCFQREGDIERFIGGLAQAGLPE